LQGQGGIFDFKIPEVGREPKKVGNHCFGGYAVFKLLFVCLIWSLADKTNKETKVSTI
jgi:hypothetical protein